MIRILITADNGQMQNHLRDVIVQAHDMTIIAEASDTSTLLSMVSKLQPDVLLFGIVTLLPHYLDVIEAIGILHPWCKTVVISSPIKDDALMMQAFVKGLAGHLEGDPEISAPALHSLVRTASSGGTILPPRLMRMVVDELSGRCHVLH